MTAETEKESLFNGLLEVDPDDLYLKIASIPFAHRVSYFDAALKISIDSSEKEAVRQKAVLLLREILAGSEPVLSESDAARNLKLIVALDFDGLGQELIRSLLILTGLLIARITRLDKESQQDLRAFYLQLSGSPDSETSKISSQLATRLVNRSIVFPVELPLEAELKSRRTKIINDLDLPVAARNVTVDAGKDWLIDPWSWPELGWLSAEGRHVVEERLSSSSSGYVVRLDVAKDRFSTRPALVMDPVDRLAYQSLIDKMSLELVGHLPKWVYGWRLSREQPRSGSYADNKVEWKLYIADLEKRRKYFKYAAHFDIRSFFSSVPLGPLVAQLLRSCRSYYFFERLEQFLHSWNSATSRNGIPQRFLASSLLAQAYLRPLDDFLGRMVGLGSEERVGALRWMDDIWVFSNENGVLQDCSRELNSLLEQLGLEFNSDKTLQFDSQKIPSFLSLPSMSDENTPRPPLQKTLFPDSIERKIDNLLLHSEESPRTKFSYVTSSMVKSRMFGSIAQLESRLDELPHLSDLIARLLRLSGRWSAHEEWYLAYLNRRLSPTDWSIEGWSGMFPLHPQQIPQKLIATFAEKLGSSLQTVVVPRVCHLLSSWRPEIGNSVFTGPLSLTMPFEFRGVAFAGLACEVDHKQINDWLGAFPQTTYLIEFLKSRGFLPFSFPPDEDSTLTESAVDSPDVPY